MLWIYRHISSLSTPCGEITVTDEKENKCRFSVKKNPYNPDYHLFYGTEKEEAFNTDTNYLICIHASDLIVGDMYKVCITGCQLHYGDSDEHTEAVSGTLNGYSIAIGSYDPNDEEKMAQAYEYSRKQGFLACNMIKCPPQYDESCFVQYDVEMLEDCSGFRFCLLENTIQEISFSVAWVKNKYENLLDYEDAVEFWTT